MAGKLSGVPNEAYDIMRATDFKWGTFKDENGIDLLCLLEDMVSILNLLIEELEKICIKLYMCHLKYH